MATLSPAWLLGQGPGVCRRRDQRRAPLPGSHPRLHHPADLQPVAHQSQQQAVVRVRDYGAGRDPCVHFTTGSVLFLFLFLFPFLFLVQCVSGNILLRRTFHHQSFEAGAVPVGMRMPSRTTVCGVSMRPDKGSRGR